MRFSLNKRHSGGVPKKIIALAEEICEEQSDGQGERVPVFIYDTVTLDIEGKKCFGAFLSLGHRARIAIAARPVPDCRKDQREPLFAETLYHEIMHAKQWGEGVKISEPNARRWAERQTNNRYGLSWQD